MEAIVELIVATVGGLFELIIGLVMFFVELFVEVILICVYGLTEGRRRSKQRRDNRTALEATEPKNTEAATDSAIRNPDASVATMDPRTAPISGQAKLGITAGAVALLLLVVIPLGYMQKSSWQDDKRREEATEIALDQAANRIVETFKQNRKVAPVPGMLAEKDGWDNPLELFVDDFEVGYLLVVRSNGKDAKSGTIDDKLTIKTVQNDPAQAAKDVLERGVEVFKKKFGKKQ